MILSKGKLKASFSKSARSYDEFSDFQKDTGLLLVERILADRYFPKRILDIGMGTGVVTEEVTSSLNAVTIGCDIAWGMVSYSNKRNKTIRVSQTDAESLSFKANTFDMVFSNIVYQWIQDLEGAFRDCARVLKTGGRFYLSIFCDGTLKELYSILSNGNGFFPSQKKVLDSIRDAGFKELWSESHAVKRPYDKPWNFLKTLKNIGAGRVSDSVSYEMGKRGEFLKMLDRYEDMFSCPQGVYATYKVQMVCAQKS